MPPKGADEVSRVSNQACWLGNPRRGCGIAPTPIFQKPRAQWPGRNRRKPLKFCAPEIFCLAQGVTPVNGVRGALPNPSLLPAKPSEAGSPGRGGARERTQFSPPGGNGVEWTQGELARRAKRRWPGPLRRRAAMGKGTRRPQAAKFPCQETNPLYHRPLIRHGFAVPPFPIPSVASRHLPLIRGVGPQGGGLKRAGIKIPMHKKENSPAAQRRTGC